MGRDCRLVIARGAGGSDLFLATQQLIDEYELQQTHINTRNPEELL